MAQPKKKPAPRGKAKAKNRGGRAAIKRAPKKPAPKAPAPVNPLVGKKTQAAPDWIDVTIIKWHGFFRGVMMEVAWNYTRQAFEVHISGRGIGDFPTVEAAKAAAVAAVLAQQEGR